MIKAPTDSDARNVYVANLRIMYINGTLDEALKKSFTHVPDLLLSELFPQLFPISN